jgi:thioredoxin-related protein
MKKIFISLLVLFSLFCVACKKSEKIIEVTKLDVQDTNKYNIYLERDGRIIYLSSNLKEVNYKGETVKDYISKTYQTMDDSLKSITDLMEHESTVRDGGTNIYRSEKYDLTIIMCNRIKPNDASNRDVYLGDYKLEFNNNMCGR